MYVKGRITQKKRRREGYKNWGREKREGGRMRRKNRRGGEKEEGGEGRKRRERGWKKGEERRWWKRERRGEESIGERRGRGEKMRKGEGEKEKKRGKEEGTGERFSIWIFTTQKATMAGLNQAKTLATFICFPWHINRELAGHWGYWTQTCTHILYFLSLILRSSDLSVFISYTGKM